MSYHQLDHRHSTSEEEAEGFPTIHPFEIDPRNSFGEHPFTIEPIKTLGAHYVSHEGEEIFIDSLDWRESRTLKIQLAAVWVVFLGFGLNDQVLGTLLPKLQEYYAISDARVGMIFLFQSIGYAAAAFSTEPLHAAVGLRGVVMGGLGSSLLGFGVALQAPSFFLLVGAYTFIGFGLGAEDASLNAWLGKLTHSNQLLGIFHGTYGLGCFLAPPITAFMVEHGLPWHRCYWCLIICGLVAMGLCMWGFLGETAVKYRHSVSVSLAGELEVTLKETIKNQMVWLFALCLFVYVGAEGGLGSWLVTYMMRVKEKSHTTAALVTSSYWFGLTLGRLVLGFCTAWLPLEFVANIGYLCISAVGVVGVALVPHSPTLLVITCLFTGFFIGPVFQTCVAAAAKALPPRLHVSGISFSIGFAAVGFAFFPWFIGFLNGLVGSMRLLPVFVVVLLAGSLAAWLRVVRLAPTTSGLD